MGRAGADSGQAAGPGLHTRHGIQLLLHAGGEVVVDVLRVRRGGAGGRLRLRDHCMPIPSQLATAHACWMVSAELQRMQSRPQKRNPAGEAAVSNQTHNGRQGHGASLACGKKACRKAVSTRPSAIASSARPSLRTYPRCCGLVGMGMGVVRRGGHAKWGTCHAQHAVLAAGKQAGQAGTWPAGSSCSYASTGIAEYGVCVVWCGVVWWGPGRSRGGGEVG